MSGLWRFFCLMGGEEVPRSMAAQSSMRDDTLWLRSSWRLPLANPELLLRDPLDDVCWRDQTNYDSA